MYMCVHVHMQFCWVIFFAQLPPHYIQWLEADTVRRPSLLWGVDCSKGTDSFQSRCIHICANMLLNSLWGWPYDCLWPVDISRSGQRRELKVFVHWGWTCCSWTTRSAVKEPQWAHQRVRDHAEKSTVLILLPSKNTSLHLFLGCSKSVLNSLPPLIIREITYFSLFEISLLELNNNPSQQGPFFLVGINKPSLSTYYTLGLVPGAEMCKDELLT